MLEKISIIGECMIEISENQKGIYQYFGGDTSNTAIYLARLLNKSKLSVYYVTAVGTDPFSTKMINMWKKENINVSLVRNIRGYLPGLYYIKPNSIKEKIFYYWRQNSAAKFLFRNQEGLYIFDQLMTFDYIYLSGITIAILSKRYREKMLLFLEKFTKNKGKLIFDSNYRPKLWKQPKDAREIYKKILAISDISFLTLEDEHALWGNKSIDKIIQSTHKLGTREVVVRQGKDPCIVSTNGKIPIIVNGINLSKQKVVDTTAAGDSFSAGYLSMRLSGKSMRESAQHGHLIAHKVVQYRGAIIPMDKMP